MLRGKTVNKKITVTGANKLFFIFVVLFLIFQVILMFLSVFYGSDFIDRNIYSVLLVNQYILILLPVLIFIAAGKLSFKEVLRLNHPGIIPVFLIILCSLPAYFVASFINSVMVYILQFIGEIPSQPIPVPHNYNELVTGLLVIAVSPAICEELLHRGILLKAYEKRGSMRAVFITSVIFGFFHFDITNFFGPIFLGILIGYYVIRTNSIFAGMLAHFANNAIAEMLLFISGEDVNAGKNITITLQELGAVAVYGIGGLGLLAILLMTLRHVTEGKSLINPPIASIKQDIFSVVTHWPMVVVFILYALLGGLYILSMVMEKYNMIQSLNALSQISTFLL